MLNAYFRTLKRKSGSTPPFDPRAGRYVDSQVFTSLIRGGWIGSGADAAGALEALYLPTLRDAATGATTMAFDMPLPPQSPTKRSIDGTMGRMIEASASFDRKLTLF